MNESPDNSNGITERFEHDQPFRDNNTPPSGASYGSHILDETAITRAKCDRQEEKPYRQRLLVVANRLPVSAVRKGDDSWSLEMSAGGLVTALLGKL